MWKNKLHEVPISSAVTSSLEALALWIVHNYEEKWKSEGTTRESPAKYTGMTKGNRLYCGWSDAGINKFNEMVAYVRRNRELGQNFEKIFQNKMIKEHEDNLIKKQKTTARNVATICVDDLDARLADTTSSMIYNRVPPHTTIQCNLSGNQEVASTISHSSASASYHSGNEYFSVGDDIKNIQSEQV